jgi:hypothetical protein
MKEKILNAIKAKVGKTDISDKTFNAYVDIILAQITDESQIETAIAPSVVVLKEIQANINSVAANAAKAKETELKTLEDQKKAAEDAAKKAAETGGEETPAWAKAILESNKVLTDRLSAIEGERVQQTHAQRLAEKVKDIPDWYKNPIVTGRSFKDETELDAFAESVVTGWGTAKQSLANQGFQDATPPEQGAGVPQSDVSSIVSQIEAGTKEIIELKSKK